MRPTYNAIWVVPDTDGALVAAVTANDGTPQAMARVARVLVHARPDDGARVTGDTADALLASACAVAAEEAAEVIAAGREAADALGLTLSSVSSSTADRLSLARAGGVEPGLLVQLVAWDPAVLALAGSVALDVLPGADLEAIRAEALTSLPQLVERLLESSGFVWAGVRLGLGTDSRTYWLAAAAIPDALTYPQPPIVGLDGTGVLVFESAAQLAPAAAAAVSAVQQARAAGAWTGAAVMQATTPDEIDAALSALGAL